MRQANSFGREWILRRKFPEHRAEQLLNHRIRKRKSSICPDAKPGSQLLHQPALHALALNDDDLFLRVEGSGGLETTCASSETRISVRLLE